MEGKRNREKEGGSNKQRSRVTSVRDRGTDRRRKEKQREEEET